MRHLILTALIAALAAGCAQECAQKKATPFAVKGCAVVLAKEFAATKGEAWARDAANDLAGVLSKVTDSQIPLYVEDKVPTNVTRIVYIGRLVDTSNPLNIKTSNASPSPVPGEFRIRVTGERADLLGRSETGASFAMTEFVERFCGYKFLSQNGEDPYDVQPDLTVPPCDFTKRPAIPYLNVYRCWINGWLKAPYMPKSAANFFAFQRKRRLRVREADYAPEFRCRRINGSDCHQIYAYLPIEKYFKTHPEWYSMDKSGHRCNIANAGGQICFSNMAMRDEYAKNLIAMIDADKKANPANCCRLYDMGQGDSCTQLCFCPECLKIVAKYNRVKGGNWEGGDGGLQLEWANDIMRRVRAKHPDIKLRIFAYCSSEERPKELAVEPGLIPWFCDLYTFSNHMLPLEHPQNRVKLENLKDWCAQSEYVKVWDYMMYGGIEVNDAALAADAKLFAKLGIKDLFMESEFHYQPFYDLNMYLMGELYFDPSKDPEKLIDAWCRVYGKAAPKMREAIDFVRTLEQTQIPATLELWHNGHLPWHTVGNYEKFRTLCLEAYAMDEAPSVRQRIAIAIDGADSWLAGKYRCTYGKGALAKERLAEAIRMEKEWATYELRGKAQGEGDGKKIREVEALVDSRRAIAAIRFGDLPAELKDVPEEDLKCLDTRGGYITGTNNDETRVVPDAGSETGRTLTKRYTRQGAKIGYRIAGGVYDTLLKKVLTTFTLEIPESRRDGKYHWYKLGKEVTIDRQSKMWLFGGWGMQCQFNTCYTICDGAALDINTFEIWVSVRVDEKTPSLNFDRVCLKRVKR